METAGPGCGGLATRLENAASRVADRVMAHFTARDWDAAAELITADFSSDDRRRTVNAGTRHGQGAAMKDARANADLGAKEVVATVIATRGERLVLRRARYSGNAHHPDAFHVDALSIFQINGDGRAAATVTFDLEDIDAAFAELDARYLADEGAAYAGPWSVIAELYAGFNRHELPATTPDWVFLDHRQLINVKARELSTFIDALWEQMSGVSIHVEAVHRLNYLGAVVTHTAQAVSRDDVNAEWRMIDLYTVDGNRISRHEMFDETHLAAALARFDELSGEVP